MWTAFAQKVDIYFQELEKQNRFSSAVLDTKGESILYRRAFGYASRSWGVLKTLQIRFDTASITKLFTAVAALQLIEEGLLALNTSAIDLFGINDTTISPRLNVYHLLSHTSGIGDDVKKEDGEINEDLWKTRSYYIVTETVDFLPQFILKAPNFPPGQGCRYNNCGYILLGLVVEEITGLSYREYVRKNIIAKAGMTHSDFYRMDRVNDNVAKGADPIFDNKEHIIGWKKNIYSYPPI